ncbi:Gfo/Idh/MocA family protein [Vagococcus acidifermentans]|uniref:Dehydrogenase n=1 Tax=Vagococcus acidifermentans TaxID=564710 RepID=A0A430AT27_9ENTE|nr:Gfo/Idh/MocA family oxidoreductase [Vagococcus acidifermentans]RSU11215.1 dehydrogenase [Vagococcus acidifermentans]
MTTIKLDIIGYGGMGRYHATTIIPKETNIMVNGVYDIDPERLTLAEKEGFRIYSSLSQLLNDTDSEAVLIATPNDSHKELACRAMRAGKHVVCEKPVMMNSQEFAEVLDVAEETDRVFMVHQNRRWDEDFLIIRQLYQTQEIGELFQIESRVQGANGIPGDWRHLKQHGGGMLLDWGVHLLDQLLFLVDSPVKSVVSELSYVLGDEVDDGFISYITFDNGVKSLIEVGTSNFIKLPRWYVKGYSGTAVIHDWDLSGDLVKQVGQVAHHELIPVQAGQGLTKTMAPPSEDAAQRLSLPAPVFEHPTFYTNFYQVIRQDAAPVVKNAEVMRVMQLIEDIFASAEKRAVIHY